MRFLIIAAALVLASCSSIAGLEQSGPTLESHTAKSPREYARCLTPAWQDINSSVTSTETERGYRLLLNVEWIGVPVMATVDGSESGATVKVYLMSTWKGASGWESAARRCL